MCTVYFLDEAGSGMVGSIVQDMAIFPLRGNAEEKKQAGKADNSVHGEKCDEEHVDSVDHGCISNVVYRAPNGIHDRGKSRH